MRCVQRAIILLLLLPQPLLAERFPPAEQVFDVDVIASLDDPWGMTFTPNGDILITQKQGALRVVRNNRLLDSAVEGLPDIRVKGQGGLLDIALDPDFAANQRVYLSYAAKGHGGYGTEVVRGQLFGNTLKNLEVIFQALPKGAGGRHFGSRLLFAADGALYVSLGDRGHRPNGQDLSSHAGSLIRILPDGRVPQDNPFNGIAGVRGEIYTYGNRNIQGMAMHPGTGEVWTHEHGPQGGDELNIMRAGGNYGWADITYGVNYGIGTRIGEGTEREDVIPPVHYWTPSIAPSGMTFYTADRFPKWKSSLFVGSLKFQQLVRLQLEGDRVVGETRVDFKKYGRVRDVRQGPDGYIYVLTEGGRGGLLRLSPVN